MRKTQLLLAIVLSSLAVTLVTLSDAGGAEAPAALEVYLIRHAEKVDDSRDPELSAAGEERAHLLVDVLSGAGIQEIHSTDYLRTRETARPLAEALGLDVQSYDPDDLEGFAVELEERGGIHLVVGHSNTTPALVEALGGDPVSAIDEAEYDRVYHVVVDADGAVRSELTGFGERFGGG